MFRKEEHQFMRMPACAVSPASALAFERRLEALERAFDRDPHEPCPPPCVSQLKGQAGIAAPYVPVDVEYQLWLSA
jgi:hypothetical protein